MRSGSRLWIGTLCGAIVGLAAFLGRADAPAGRYSIASGTVTDSQTGLVWQQALEGTPVTHAAATTYCEDLTLDGGNWRLPSALELQTLVDESRTDPAVDTTAFPNTLISLYWTSTMLAGDATKAWGVFFDRGGTSYSDVGLANLVRCVR